MSADLRLFIWVLTLKDEKKDYFIALTMTANLIKKIIGKN